MLSCPTEKIIEDLLRFIQSNNLEKSYKYIYNLIEINVISLLELINYIYAVSHGLKLICFRYLCKFWIKC